MTALATPLLPDSDARSARWVRVGLALSGLLALLGCIYAVAFCSSGPDISGHAVGVDDAYISYLYARNLVQGHGLVFNPGEYVEGYSNLLYVLLMAIPFTVGIDVFAFSVVLNTLFVLGTWWILVRFLQTRLGDRAAVWGGFLFALSPSIWIWASSGLETPMIVLLQTAIWVGVANFEESRSSRRSLALLCTCAGLLVLARADGFISGLLAAGYLLVKGKRRAAATVGATLFCTYAALVSWRMAYYHDILPNTYYAKVTSTLLVRLRSAVKELGGIVSRDGIGGYLMAIAFSLAPFVRRFVKEPYASFRDLHFGLVFSVAWLGYWLYIGGDTFEDRFLIILIPIGIFLLLGTVLRDAPKAVGAFAVAVLILFQLTPIVRLEQFGKSREAAAKYDHRIKLGKFLKEHTSARSLATTAAGKIPFFSELPTLDMLGLCDKHIGRLKVTEFVVGHSKHDTEYTLAKKPDVIAVTFDGDGLDVMNMKAEQYQRAGYRIHYVVNNSATSRGDDDILDVLSRKEADIVLLTHIGWRLAVLDRAPGNP
jgi:hypothetical protein